MNRRGFLKGLLYSAAVLSVPARLPAAPAIDGLENLIGETLEVYSRSPAMVALPSLDSLNAMRKHWLVYAETVQRFSDRKPFQLESAA